MKKIIAIIIALLIIIFIISRFGDKEVVQNNIINTSDQAEVIIDAEQITIPVKHKFIDGTHRFVGVIELPSPCHAYSAEVEEGVAPNISISIFEPDSDNVCAQLIVKRTFDVSYDASEHSVFTASINDEPAVLNIFEISDEDEIDDVELFLKG